MNGWSIKHFKELNTEELWAILRLRQEVFILEQECLYADMDDIDLKAQHLAFWAQEELHAYARLIAPSKSNQYASIGRVVVTKSMRDLKLGRSLMLRAIKEIEAQHPESAIKIGAQKYLENFYNGLGFSTISDVYIEDGIPHIHMLKNTTDD